MGQPYVGEIRIFAGSFAPAGWSFCNGALMPISENDTLFNLIGTTYGGDGENTFALPDLQGRVPVHMGTGSGSTYTIGEKGGVESVTLNSQQIPIHTHLMPGTGTGQALSPASAYMAVPTSTQGGILGYAALVPNVALVANLTSVGGNQPHTNFQPTLAINYIISLFGIYPSPT